MFRYAAPLVFAGVLAAQELPYIVEFPLSPASPGKAAATLDDRISAAVRFEACGNELEFFDLASASDAGENINAMIIAKMLWASGGLGPNSPRIFPFVCASHIRRGLASFSPADADDLSHNRLAAFNARLSALWSCPNIITNVVTPLGSGAIDIYFQVTAGCMKTQVNLAIKRMTDGGKRPGTPVPCNAFFDKQDGDWDVNVRQLTRVFYLNEYLPGAVLDPPTRDYIFEHLLTISGPVGSDSYALASCGDTENSQGSPEDRADEKSWLDKAWEDIPDWLKWLVVIAALIALAAAFPALAPVIVAAVVIGGGVLLGTRIPETENHRLMIESSRYLANQHIVQTLRDKNHPDADRWAGYMSDGKEWILDRLQSILREDFIEYNSKPYGRYSINAILNLYDFAVDKDIKTAAEAILTYSTAKFAVGSLEGRRIPPWRRRLQGIDRPDITMMADYADHLIPFMMIQAGEVEHLPVGQVTDAAGATHDAAFLTAGAVSEMINSCSSRYRLGDVAPIVLELAIAKYDPFFQRIGHAGVEIYSGNRDYLITAGGVQTDYAYHGSTFFVISTGGLKQDDSDRGSAPPTTFMSVAGAKTTNWTGFLRFEGQRIDYDVADAPGKSHSFDNNTCVWQDFACGTNLVVPSPIDMCFTPHADGWRFLDASTCPELKPARAGSNFFLALYQRACPGGSDACKTKWGLLEAVDSPASTFASFRSGVIARNSGGDIDDGAMSGTYHSASGHAIQFTAAPPLAAGGAIIGPMYAITAVDGVATDPILTFWPRADGSFMRAKRGEALVRIEKGTHWVELDLRNTPKITFKYN